MSQVAPKIATSLLALLLIATPGVSVSDIIWSGDFSTGDFRQYPVYNSSKEVRFPSIPDYGRPIQYGGQHEWHVGNGELLSLVSVDGRSVGGIKYPAGPTRGGPYSAKFTVKSQSGGGKEPADCDPRGSDNCTRRRSQLNMQATHPDMFNAIPHMGERWVSFSVFLDKDWPNLSQSGFNPVLLGIKQRVDSYAKSGLLSLGIENNAWDIKHRWNHASNPSDSKQWIPGQTTSHPWEFGMFYSGNYDGQPYPRRDNWPDGLVDFPDVAKSHAALQSLNVGGWTDWVLHWKQDHRGSREGGTGFLRVWKREDSGPWIEVLHIRPKKTTRGGITFDHGIGYNLSAFSGSSAGSGTIIGAYMGKNAVWDSPTNRVLYVANHKIGSARASFSQMSHDGSAPGFIDDAAAPKPPVVTVQ